MSSQCIHLLALACMWCFSRSKRLGGEAKSNYRQRYLRSPHFKTISMQSKIAPGGKKVMKVSGLLSPPVWCGSSAVLTPGRQEPPPTPPPTPSPCRALARRGSLYGKTQCAEGPGAHLKGKMTSLSQGIRLSGQLLPWEQAPGLCPFARSLPPFSRDCSAFLSVFCHVR